MNRRAYPTDTCDNEWAILAPLLVETIYGRPLLHLLREMVNAIHCQGRAGCAWRQLPHDLLPHQAVPSRFRRWREDGTRERVPDELWCQLRVAPGR